MHMISLRYDNDGKPLLKLNELQLRMKQQIEQKVESGVYEFETVSCLVCDGVDFELLSKKDRYGLYFPVVVCRDCGLIQTNPRMNQVAYNEFYNIEYRKLYVGSENPTSEFFQIQYEKGRRIFEYLKDKGFLGVFENGCVLEVGCGAGGILYYFKQQGCRVKGIDLGEAYIEYGRSQYDLDLSLGTIHTLELDESPDLIIYSHVLEHILVPNEELQKVYDTLRDEGLLYIEVPGIKNLMSSYEMDFLRILQNAHTYHFTLTSLANLLSKNDFELLSGNQKVNSVFGKAKNKGLLGGIKDEYLSVIEYLQKVERFRRICPLPPYKVRDSLKSVVMNILKTVGLFGFIRGLYRRVRTRS